MPGAMEHRPVPLAQPTCADVYHCRMRPPELSSTQSRYCVAVATAFHTKVGVVTARVPVGATSVVAPGGLMTLLTVMATGFETALLPRVSRAVAVRVYEPLLPLVVSQRTE